MPARKAPVIPLRPSSDITASEAFMRADLARSGLTPSDLDVEPLPTSRYDGRPSYRIWYPDRAYWRDRIDRVKDKYIGTGNTPTALYVAGGGDGGIAAANLVVLTEGEKKTVAAHKYLRCPALGIGGKDCWHLRDEAELGPALAAAVKALRPGAMLIVVPDGDINQKHDVAASYGSLVTSLSAQRADITTRVVALPNETPRLGLDDWLVRFKNRRNILDLFMKLHVLDESLLPRMKWDVAAALQLITHERKNADGKIERRVLTIDANARLAIKAWHDFARDTTLGPIERLPGVGKYRRVTDGDAYVIAIRLQTEVATGFTVQHTRNAIAALLHENECSILAEELRALRWDGQRRIERAFSTYWGATDTPYARDAAWALLTGLVGRAINPGVQFDHMVVLIGPQGTYKSTSLKVLAGRSDRYAEITHISSINDLARIGASNWLLDIAEMHAFSKIELGQFRAFVTANEDKFIDKFDKLETCRPKGYVLIGSTNETQFLRDPNDERRYLPIVTTTAGGRIDIEALRRDRDQLFAEAVARYLKSGIHYEIRDAATVRERHKPRSSWEEDLDAWLDVQGRRGFAQLNGRDALTLRQVITEPGFAIYNLSQKDRYLAAAVKARGWEESGVMISTRGLQIANEQMCRAMFGDKDVPRQARLWLRKGDSK